MPDDLPCLVLDCTNADAWPDRFGSHALVNTLARPRRIEAGRAPTILQPNREIAEAEAKRLAAAHIGRRFVVFQAVAVGMSVEVPTHTNLRGEVLYRRAVPTVLELGDGDDLPF